MSETSETPNMDDAAEMLWVVLANVSGGDWTQQSQEWQDAAARWRDNYFTALNAASRPPAQPETPAPTPEGPAGRLRQLAHHWKQHGTEGFQCVEELEVVAEQVEAEVARLTAALETARTGLTAIQPFLSEGQHTGHCNGDEDGPCDCGVIDPRDVVEVLIEQLAALAASSQAAETGTSHRCSGCAHRWDGPLVGAELCGDCWRKVQTVLHAPPGAEPGTEPAQEER